MGGCDKSRKSWQSATVYCSIIESSVAGEESAADIFHRTAIRTQKPSTISHDSRTPYLQQRLSAKGFIYTQAASFERP